MHVQWVTGALLLVAATSAGAAELAWGRAVEGVQLGLSIAPDSGPLPSELRLEVQVRNVTSEPQQLAVEACSQLRWTPGAPGRPRLTSGRVKYRLGLPAPASPPPAGLPCQGKPSGGGP